MSNASSGALIAQPEARHIPDLRLPTDDLRRFATYQARWTAAVAQGRVYNLKERQFGPVPEPMEAAVRSSVTKTLRWRLQREHEAAEALHAERDPSYQRRPFNNAAFRARLNEPDFDVRPYLHLLAEDVRTRFEASRNPRGASVGVNNVERWLATVLGPGAIARVPKKRVRRAAPMPAGWTDIERAIPEIWRSEQTQKGVRSDVSRVALCVLKHGVLRPYDLPAAAALDDWLKASDLPAYVRAHFYGHWRAIRKHFLEVRPELGRALPDYPIVIKPAAHNLRREPKVLELVDQIVPDEVLAGGDRLAALQEQLGEERFALFLDVRMRRRRLTALSLDELFALVAPAFGLALKRYRDCTTVRPATLATVADALDRLVAQLIRMGFGHDLWEARLGPLEMFERFVEVEPEALATRRRPREETKDGADTLARLVEATLGHPAPTLQVPLGQLVLAELGKLPAPRSIASRRLGGSPHITHANKSDLEKLWMLVADVYKPIIIQRASNTVRWATIEAHNRAIRTFAEDQRAIAGATRTWKDKAKLISHCTLPQLVCVGLPMYAAHVEALAAAYDKARAAAETRRPDAKESAAVRAARGRFLSELEHYIVLATFVTDPMRHKNLLMADLGSEIQIEFEAGAAPGARRIKRIRSVFTGNGGINPAAALKKERKTGTKNEIRARQWWWSPGILHFGLTARYLRELRGPRLVAHGKLPAPYDLEAELAGTERFPWFVANPTYRVSARTPLHPSEAAIVHAFAWGLWWVLTNAFGVEGVPRPSDGRADDESAAVRDEWWGLLAPHIVRLLWTTYWLGVVGEDTVRRPTAHGEQRITGIEIAKQATNDDEKTLRSHYSEVTPTMDLLRRELPTDWQHPNVYDALMARVWWMDPIDWAAEHERIPLPPHLEQQRAARLASRPRPRGRPRKSSNPARI